MKQTINLKVSGKSNVSSVAGSIVKSITEGGNNVELHAIGASSVNQTVKAIASASGILATKAITVCTRIGFSETEINGATKTMMIFKIILL